MPVEIKELIIRATVDPAATGSGESPGGEKSAGNKEELIAECVEQVLEILRRKDER